MTTSLTKEQIIEFLDYRDGVFYWIKLPSFRVKLGDRAGSVGKNGYECIRLNNRHYLTHRLVFMLHHGFLPKMIDHRDGNPLNNHINNLRECSEAQNHFNQKKSLRVTTSRWKGVYYDKRDCKWISRIMLNRKTTVLGYFTNEDDAAVAYNSAAKTYFGEFACLNVISGNEPVD